MKEGKITSIYDATTIPADNPNHPDFTSTLKNSIEIFDPNK